MKGGGERLGNFCKDCELAGIRNTEKIHAGMRRTLMCVCVSLSTTSPLSPHWTNLHEFCVYLCDKRERGLTGISNSLQIEWQTHQKAVFIHFLNGQGKAKLTFLFAKKKNIWHFLHAFVGSFYAASHSEVGGDKDDIWASKGEGGF